MRFWREEKLGKKRINGGGGRRIVKANDGARHNQVSGGARYSQRQRAATAVENRGGGSASGWQSKAVRGGNRQGRAGGTTVSVKDGGKRERHVPIKRFKMLRNVEPIRCVRSIRRQQKMIMHDRIMSSYLDSIGLLHNKFKVMSAHASKVTVQTLMDSTSIPGFWPLCPGCIAIYASPVPSIREEVWRVLTDFFRNYSGPLLAIEDFNEILLSSEVKGGNFVSRRAERFGALLDECGLIDLGVHGSLYTWFRHMQGNRFLSKRLDRGVSTDVWCFRFSESYVENLARMHSDHCPIMVRCQGNDRRVGVKPFHFQVVWSYHPSFSSVVRGAWDKGRPNPIRCLSQVRDDALAFNRDVFGNIFKRKRELERRVTSIQQRMKRVDALSLIQEERELQSEYSNLLTQEELFWKRNKVQGLFLEDGRWSTDSQELEECAIGFYRDLFCNVEQDFFFKKYWEVVGTEVWELVKKAFAWFDLDSALFDTLVVLIPKVDNPSRMKEFRPINLYNVIYKIITKVVVERLRPFLQDIIGPLRGGFIPGRGTPDNIIVAQEVLHFMKKTKSKKGVLAFKIDLEKAYDSVSWEFLEQSLLMFGFPGTIVSLIMKCVKSSSLSLMWNDNRLDGFQPKRGLRQGDLMSPYLFVICMERLSCLIARQVEVGRWKPVTVSRGGPVISHLLFADDLILFCKAKKSQVLHVLDTLATFCRASSMKVNFDKSRAICSMNVSRQHKDLFTGISSIRFANSLGKYLGVPLKHGRVTKADFHDVVDKHTNRLASWKGRFLNKAGQICLTKSVLSSIPIYRMLVSLFPSVGVRVEFLDICEAALTIEDVYRDGVWHLERIYSFIPRDLREDILSLVHISASGRDLGWSWEHTLYSAKQGYLWLIQNKLNWDRNINWLWFWKARVPEKLRLLVWLCLHDAVPTQYLRFRRHLSSSSLYCAAAFELVTGWQVPLWHLEKEVIQLIFDLKLRRDWDIRFELIPREANVVADRLVKMGSGGSETDEVNLWHQPPEVACPLLLLRT
ncbi:uncharacterized protein LOC107606708 [Arachis ipaensis]|uniref:uncharacterized protein LOC107606708 n=1 Tax=Arachis ipaensis TaxID=130454 RepID=UPI0007AFE0CD|nr:uncharacterized protein LOC107606708 [Arachis ipaensis]